MSDFFDAISDADNRITSCRHRLNRMADGFSDTGNPAVAEMLYEISYELNSITAELNKASGDYTTEMVSRTRESSQNMLKACLAGVSLASKSKEDIDKENK